MQFTPYKFWSFPPSFLFESSWQQKLGNLYSVMRGEETEPSSPISLTLRYLPWNGWTCPKTIVGFILAVIQFFKMSVSNGCSYRKKGSHIWSFPQYQSLSEVYGCPFVHKSYMSDYFSRSSGLFHHDLIGHYGCVNAIEFSNNNGEFIVSGRYHTESYSGFCP